MALRSVGVEVSSPWSLTKKRKKIVSSHQLLLLNQRWDHRVPRNLESDIEGVVLAVQPTLREQLGALSVSNTVGDVKCDVIVERDNPLFATVVSGATVLWVLFGSGIEGKEEVTHFRGLRLFSLLVGSYCYLVNREIHEDQTGAEDAYSWVVASLRLKLAIARGCCWKSDNGVGDQWKK